MRSEGYSSLSDQRVCLSVCVDAYSGTIYKPRGGLLAIPAASELREPEKQRGDFPETTAFESYAVSWKRQLYLGPRPDPLALCTLETQEVTTKGLYRLPHKYYLLA